MGHPASVWKHKRFKSRKYIGRYQWAKGMKKSDRNFTLSCLLPNGSVSNFYFDSHEAAKDAGWKRLKAKIQMRA